MNSQKIHCDKYDYITAVACGAVAGMVDIFAVGIPTDSKLVGWTDEMTDKAVKKFATLTGWKPHVGNEDSVASALGYLEGKFKINYDQKNTNDVDGLFRMGTKNHHLKSLAHSPDIIGLFFSLLDQFTSTSSFLHDGQLITVKTEAFELQGSNLPSKLFCGFFNWLGHIMSDIAGSSGSRGNAGRGTGVAIPFFEMLQLCDFGKFNIGQDKQDLATLATRVFQEGYDARFGLAMAIPVWLCNIAIKLIWAIRRFLFYKKPIMECIPTPKHDELRIMLLVGNGTLCIFDGIDAAVRSGGNALNLCLRLNYVAWMRLTHLVLREVVIRIGIGYSMDDQREAIKQNREAITEFADKLEALDIEGFAEETVELECAVAALERVCDENEFNSVLHMAYRSLDIPLPWGSGEFDSFMSSRTNRLEFK